MKQQRDEVNIIRGEKNKMKSIKRRNLLTGISGTTRSSVISTPTKKKIPDLFQKNVLSKEETSCG